MDGAEDVDFVTPPQTPMASAPVFEFRIVPEHEVRLVVVAYRAMPTFRDRRTKKFSKHVFNESHDVFPRIEK